MTSGNSVETREVQLRPVGVRRFVGAFFLAIWLTAWLIFEVLALIVLLAALMSIGLTAADQPINLWPFTSMASDGSASAVLFGVLLWLTLWTVGGVAAGTQFFRMISGEDLAAVSGNGVRVRRRAGPFTRTRFLPRDSIYRVRLRPRDKAVVADTQRGTVTISDLGALEARELLQRWLTTELSVADHGRAVRLERESPPPDWSVEVQDGESVLTSPPPAVAKVQAVIAWTVTGVMLIGCLGIFRRGVIEPEPLKAAEWSSLALTLLSALGAIWVTFARRQWRLGWGRMRIQLLFGSLVLRERVFGNAALELEHHADSDGDDHYALEVHDSTSRKVLSRRIHDQFELLALGEWLSARTNFPFHRPF